MPTLIVRTVYGLLYEFTSSDAFAMWNPLFGSPTAFALMCLLAEYVTLLTYVFLGLHRMRQPEQEPPENKVAQTSSVSA